MEGNTQSAIITIEDELNSIRSVLRSDDDLLVQPSGDYEQVRVKLDHDILVSYFFDALQLAGRPLTVGVLHDLRISKGSSKSPLNQDQWSNIRKAFDELVRKSDSNTSLRSLIQLVQDQILRLRVVTHKYKPKEKKSNDSAAAAATATAVEDESSANGKFRGGDLIFNRILHDKAIDRTQVVIGYEDRFSGMHEIAFNEFKKVHDHEYGVPMHRIRYFKIGGRTVWDRTKKLDTLTGSDQQNEANGDARDIGQGLPVAEGLYHFDTIHEEWVLVPQTSLSSDDPKAPSAPHTCLPAQPQLLTWNILFDYHHSSRIHTQHRYPAILQTLKTLLPDLIALQEVTAPFLRLLLNEPWLQQHNYYIIMTHSVITSEQDKTYGQLLLMKNFQPRAFAILPLTMLDDQMATAATTAGSTIKKTSKEVIIARFGVSARATIDIVNLHLQSSLARDSDSKRCQALESLFASLKAQNYMLVGDFNFGDYDQVEQALLLRHESTVHDLWRDIYNIEENPGLTFDPSRNVCAAITSKSQINRRFDRFLLHTLQNLHYSVQHLDMIGLDTITIESPNGGNETRMNLSDHYGLQLVVNFNTRSTSHRSALALLPTSEHWPLIDQIRREYDPSFGRWPVHINVLWPFFDLTGCEDDEASILVPLRLALSGCASFDADVQSIQTFTENNVCYLQLDEASRDKVKGLYEQAKQLFPQCSTNKRGPYNPHMTIAQFDSEEKRTQAQSALALKEPFRFAVPYLYILQRPHDDDITPFHITYQLPLGPVLQPLGLQQHLSATRSQLEQFFHQMNLYEDQQAYQRKRDKLDALTVCFNELFNGETLHCFTHAFLPYGSFRLGIKGADVDTVFVLSEVQSSAAKTSFDQTLLTLKSDPASLTNRIAQLLESQLDARLKDQISSYRRVEALYPIIIITFRDQTQVEIFVQVQTIKDHSSETKPRANADAERLIHGVHEIEQLVVHARSPAVFQHLLAFVRTWAQQVGLYGQVFGYLGGYSWAILCAHVCHSFLSPIESLASIEHLSVDDFYTLVHSFFLTFATFNWPVQALRLHAKSAKTLARSDRAAVQNRGSMRIISPCPPYHNTARSTIDSTRDLIARGFERVVELLNSVNSTTSEEKSAALQQVLQLDKPFPNTKVKTLLQLTLSAADSTELDEWLGWLKSRLAHFLNECEIDCHLVMQTDNALERRANNTEVLYSIGFQLDETALNSQRNFHYTLNKFIEQFNTYPNRKQSMQIGHKLLSVHDWKMERAQPKPQRTRK